jgi:hypothetical protein
VHPSWRAAHDPLDHSRPHAARTSRLCPYVGTLERTTRRRRGRGRLAPARAGERPHGQKAARGPSRARSRLATALAAAVRSPVNPDLPALEADVRPAEPSPATSPSRSPAKRKNAILLGVGADRDVSPFQFCVAVGASSMSGNQGNHASAVGSRLTSS